MLGLISFGCTKQPFISYEKILLHMAGRRHPTWNYILMIAPPSVESNWCTKDAIGAYCLTCDLTIDFQTVNSIDKHVNTFHDNQASNGSCISAMKGAGSQNDDTRSSTYDMVPVDDAVQVVLENVLPLNVVKLPSSQALHHVSAENVKSTVALPPYAASTMDGYAIHVLENVSEYMVVGSGEAGVIPEFYVEPGCAAYITTGAPIPAGANAVVKIEDTTRLLWDAKNEIEKSIKVKSKITERSNIRPVGFDVQVGDMLISRGDVIGPAQIGLLATTNCEDVQVYDSPTVGVMSTGNELVDSLSKLCQGKIRDSNRPMLLSAIRAAGFHGVDLGIVADTESLLKDKFVKALDQVDILITTGGVSMGKLDLIKPLLEQLGLVHFGRLLMKPGKPTTFSTIKHKGDSKYVFGLPGNPVSSFVTFHLLVLPALQRLRGFSPENSKSQIIQVSLNHDFKLDANRPEYHRVSLAWDSALNYYRATSSGLQASSRLASCCNVHALVKLPMGVIATSGSIYSAIVVAGLPSMTMTRPSKIKIALVHEKPRFAVAVLTVSDRCSRQDREDVSGPAVCTFFENFKPIDFSIKATAIVPDEPNQIMECILRWTDGASPPTLVVTTGGSGFSPRDITPDVVKKLLHREAPGIVHCMLQAGLAKTPLAVLSRPVAGIRNSTLIITLPGSPKAVNESLESISGVLAHLVHLIHDIPHGHHKSN